VKLPIIERICTSKPAQV